jgi:hypothetical protein
MRLEEEPESFAKKAGRPESSSKKRKYTLREDPSDWRAIQIYVGMGSQQPKQCPADIKRTEQKLISEMRGWLDASREWEIGVRATNERGEAERFAMVHGWTYRLEQLPPQPPTREADSKQWVETTIVGLEGHKRKHHLDTRWTKEQVRTEIAKAMGERDNARDLVMITDEKGRWQQHWEVHQISVLVFHSPRVMYVLKKRFSSIKLLHSPHFMFVHAAPEFPYGFHRGALPLRVPKYPRASSSVAIRITGNRFQSVLSSPSMIRSSVHGQIISRSSSIRSGCS